MPAKGLVVHVRISAGSRTSSGKGVPSDAGLACGYKTRFMAELSFHCPRCKTPFSGTNAEALTDDVIAHLEADHGHAPPRDHVLARIERHN